MPATPGVAGRRLLAVVNEEKLRRILARMLDEAEFYSPHGIRSLSRAHQEHPFVFCYGDQEFRVGYLPGDSDSGMFGGNSNWRGPVWMPVNHLLYVALLRLAAYTGDELQGRASDRLRADAHAVRGRARSGERLTSIFLRDGAGRRPVFGGAEKFQSDPHWRDHLLFYEYFHGDNGAGIGASHQTGWTGCIAIIIQSGWRADAADSGRIGAEIEILKTSACTQRKRTSAKKIA
jgi:hypothetical protein